MSVPGKGFGVVHQLEDLCRMVRTHADRPGGDNGFNYDSHTLMIQTFAHE